MKNSASIEYYELFGEDFLQPGDRVAVSIDGVDVLIFNLDGVYYAIHNSCTHMEAQLDDGELEGFEIVCPRHGAHFDIRTGAVKSLPAYNDIQTYPLKVEDGVISLGLPGVN